MRQWFTRWLFAALLFGILHCSVALASAGTNELATLVQKGLFEEEANHNLDAAKEAYQSVITQFDKDRKLAATAIFRLGEVYRKQGKTNLASEQYERLLREFPDQGKLVELSQKHASLSSWRPPAEPDPQKILEEAKADAAAGRYADALTKHVWYFENASKYKSYLSSFSNAREWVELGVLYPPALTRLKAVRDDIEGSLREGEAWRDAFKPFMNLQQINRELEENEKTLALFLWLHKNRPSAAKQAWFAARSLLIEAKEYAVCGNYISASWYDTVLNSYQISKGYDGKGLPNEHSENHFRTETSILVALLVLNNRTAEADQIIEKALNEVNDPDFTTMLDTARRGEFPPAKIPRPSAFSVPGAVRTLPTRTLRVPPIQQPAAEAADPLATAPGVIVIDSEQAQFHGAWAMGMATLATDKFGESYFWASSVPANGTNTATFRPTIPRLANYYVDVWHSAGANRSPAAQWEVVSSNGIDRISVNQTTRGGQWVRLSAYPFTFAKGTTGYVRLSNKGQAGTVVIADAVRFVPVEVDIASRSAQRMPTPEEIDPHRESAIVIDNSQAEFMGQWQFSSTPWPGTYGANYNFSVARSGEAPSATARYRPEIERAGNYHVEIQFASGGNRSTKVPWRISADQSLTTFVNQRTNGNQWFRIASSIPFKAGKSGFVEVGNNVEEPTSGQIIVADAVRFVPVEADVQVVDKDVEEPSRGNVATPPKRGASAASQPVAPASQPRQIPPRTLAVPPLAPATVPPQAPVEP